MPTSLYGSNGSTTTTNSPRMRSDSGYVAARPLPGIYVLATLLLKFSLAPFIRSSPFHLQFQRCLRLLFTYLYYSVLAYTALRYNLVEFLTAFKVGRFLHNQVLDYLCNSGLYSSSNNLPDTVLPWSIISSCSLNAEPRCFSRLHISKQTKNTDWLAPRYNS